MKIVILLRNLSVGGIQRLAIDDANELFRRGHEVWVVSFEPDSSVNDTLRHDLALPKDHIRLLSYPRLRNVGAFFRLVHLLRSIRPDLVMTHQWFASTVGRVAALVAGRQAVLSFEHSTDEKRKSRMQFVIDRCLQYACIQVVAVSKTVRDSLIRQGIRSSRIVVIENGIDLATYRSVHGRGEGNRFLFIGRLIQDKRIDVVIRALLQVPDASLTIAGDGPIRPSLEQLARECGVTDRIRFLGISHDLRTVLSEADCLVLPSVREGFGLVVLMALAAGVPVIVSQTVAENGVVKDGQNGLVVPTGDIDAFADAMHRFVSDAVLRQRLVDRGGEGLEDFSIQAHCDRILALVSKRLHL